MSNPSDYLRVSVPEPQPSGRGNLPLRLARNVAALFGVHVEDHPAGISWAGDYNQVTLVDIARGAPTPGRGKVFVADDGNPAGGFAIADRAVQQLSVPSARMPLPKKEPIQVSARRIPDLESIPPASLNEFGPDSKAASVLTGANVLFDTLSPTIQDVLQLLSTKEGQPVSDLTRAVMWTFLIGETLRSQPALFSAAFQARGVQRALSLGIHPALDGKEGATRSEFGTKEKAGGTRTPKDLGVLNTLDLPSLGHRLADVEQEIIKEGAAEDAMNQQVSAYDLTTARIGRRVVELHLQGEATYLKVVEGPNGERSVDGFVRFVSLAPVLMQELALGDLRRPFGPAATGLADALWDFTNPEHLETLLPHVPTSLELKRLSRTSQVATVLTAMALGRALREIKERQSNDPTSAVRVTKEFKRQVCDRLLIPLANNATEALGIDDPLVVLCQTVADMASIKSLYDTTSEPDGDHEQHAFRLVTQAVITDIDTLQSCVDAGEITMAQVSELWSESSPVLNRARQIISRFDESYGDQILDFMLDQWKWLEPWWEGNIQASHNYAGLLIAGAGTEAVRRGVEIASSTLADRLEADRLYGDPETNGARKTRQLIVRGLAHLLKEDPEQTDADDLDRHMSALLRSPLVDELLKKKFTSLSASQFIAGCTLLIGYREVRQVRRSTIPEGVVESLCGKLEMFMGEHVAVPNWVTSRQEARQLFGDCRALLGGSHA